MKSTSTPDLLKPLRKLRARLGLFPTTASPSPTNETVAAKVTDVVPALSTVIDFLEFARSDDSLRSVFSSQPKPSPPKPKRVPIEIPPSPTNEEIRELLTSDLTADELKEIASRRAISAGGLSKLQVREAILRNLERQEGYAKLAT